MGGFTVNGCGTGDSFYTLRLLPGKKCRFCGKTDYALMEVKRKIKVFYIPTVSLNTKYAIACPKCKNGYYISEEQKSIVLANGPECVDVGVNGVEFHLPEKTGIPVNTVEVSKEPEVPVHKENVSKDPEIAQEKINMSEEPKREYEWKKSPAEHLKVNYERGKVCPECGMRSIANRETCAICGAKL